MKEIKLTQGKVALVDDEDYEWLNQKKWYAAKLYRNLYYASSNEYNKYNKKSIVIRMHRLILNAKNGQCVDHINHNPLDNRRENIRICTIAQNIRNNSPHISSVSKYKGVFWHKQHKRWYSVIRHHRKTIHLGYFKTEQDAAITYNEEAKILFEDFAFLNQFNQ